MISSINTSLFYDVAMDIKRTSGGVCCEGPDLMHKYTKSQLYSLVQSVIELIVLQNCFLHLLILKILIPVIVKTIVYMRNDIS